MIYQPQNLYWIQACFCKMLAKNETDEAKKQELLNKEQELLIKSNEAGY